MIDMHIHSTNSDGTKTIKEILEKHKKMDLMLFQSLITKIVTVMMS